MAIPRSSSVLTAVSWFYDTARAATCMMKVSKNMKKAEHKDWVCCTGVTGSVSSSSLVGIKVEIGKVFTAHQIVTLNIQKPHDKMGALSSRRSLENTSPRTRENSQEKPTVCLQVADSSPGHKAVADVEESNGLKGNIKCFHLEILHFKGHCMNSGVRVICCNPTCSLVNMNCYLHSLKYYSSLNINQTQSTAPSFQFK